MASKERVRSAHKAYVEQVKRKFNLKYDWFSEEVAKPVDTRISDEGCGLYILDFDGVAAPKEVLNPSSSLEMDDRVLDALESEVSPGSTRLVLLCYLWEKPLYMQYAGILGHALGLDPLFFTTHFQSHWRNDHKHKWQLPSLLQLDTSIVHFRPNWSRITACVVQKAVVILHGSHDGHRSIPSRLRESLSNDVPFLYSAQSRSNPKLVPLDLVALALWIEIEILITSLDEVETQVAQNSAEDVFSYRSLEKAEFFGFHRVQTEAIVRSLDAALKSKDWSKGHAPLAERLFQEYKIILSRLKPLSEYRRDIIQQINAKTSIEETKRGIEQSDSVRRLTLVAFVFLPLNFATSFFGMNVQQLGTGGVNIGYFFLTAALIGGFAAMLSLGIKPLERRIQRNKNR